VEKDMGRGVRMKTIISFIFGMTICSVVISADNSIVLNSGWEHTSSSAYGESYTIQGRYEHRLYKNLWGGIDYGYHGGMSHNNGQDVSYGDVSGHSVLADLIWYPEVSWKLKPYILGGVGWSWWEFDNNTEVTVNLGDSFAYKVGVGALYPINSSWSLMLEWSFFKTDVPKEAHNPDGSESILLGDDHGKIGEEETTLIIGLMYNF